MVETRDGGLFVTVPRYRAQLFGTTSRYSRQRQIAYKND